MYHVTCMSTLCSRADHLDNVGCSWCGALLAVLVHGQTHASRLCGCVFECVCVYVYVYVYVYQHMAIHVHIQIHLQG